MFYNVNDLSEREKLENDINGFLKIFLNIIFYCHITGYIFPAPAP